MKDDRGKEKQIATASIAVSMMGLNAVPMAGDDFRLATSLEEVCAYLLVAFPDLSGKINVALYLRESAAHT